MSKSIQSVEGIGPKYAEILKNEGISTTDKLLEAGASKSGRKSLAEKTSLSDAHILKWVNMCDLFRINGVAGQFAVNSFLKIKLPQLILLHLLSLPMPILRKPRPMHF